MKIKKIICIAAAALLCTVGGTVCLAKEPGFAPYYSYEIDRSEKAVAAPVGFIENSIINSRSLKLETPLAAPQDFIINENGIYILDSGNSRIVWADTDKQLKRIYSGFTDSDGNPIDFTGAKGFDIDAHGNFVIADFEHNRILILGSDLVLKREISRPDEVLKNNDFPFQVSKVKCAPDGNIYAAVDSMNYGLFVFDGEGKFDKFVANNPVVKTADVIKNYVYRIFLTTEQIRNRVQSTPLRVTNFTIADNGFLYTVSQNAEQTKQSGMVRCLNFTDSDIISSDIVFGDVETDNAENKMTLFNSVDITDDGNIVLLDSGRGKVFYYSDTGYLISVFGGYGDVDGTFREPVEVRCCGEEIYVLDAQKACITEFASTDYVKTFSKAIALLKERKFDDALAAWKQVNTLNSNSSYAYYGMGLVYDLKGDYENALKCFKLAQNRTAYSNTFKEYRMIWLERHIAPILAAAFLLIAAAVVLRIFAKRRLAPANGEAYGRLETKYKFPIYTLRHPIDGFEQFKTRDVMSVGIAAGIVAVWLISEFLSKYATGFIFSTDESFNPLALVMGTIGMFTVFVVSNWCVASFLEGKGTFKEIAVTTAYALIPYVLSRLIKIPLSNVLTENEMVVLSIIGAIGILWSAFLLLGGLYAIHQYSFSKTLLSVLLTVIGMIIIVFIIIIFYSLLQQANGFIKSLYQEITL